MLKDLLNYLNTEIYPYMDEKQVEKIKSVSLAGGLMDAIRKYKNSCVKEELENDREIRSVRDETNKLTYEQVYPKGNQSVID